MYRILLILLLSVGFGNAYAQPQQVQMRKLQGYYYNGSDARLKSGVNCFVITEKKDYEKHFGTGRGDMPDFEKNWILILVMPATKKDIFLDFNSVSMKAGNFIEVYCDFNKLRGKQLTYETNPLAVCMIPAFDNVNVVNFYEERKKGLELAAKIEVKH